MPETKTYAGGCHCGRVRYEATTNLAQVISCNCSICAKHGLLLAFVPGSQFNLVSGEAELADYEFGKKTIRHRFCEACGVESFASGRTPEGVETIAVNVRCLDGVDIDSLTVTPFDGKSL